MRLLIEALLVTIVGTLLALIGNSASSRGLSLTRDYHPRVNSVANSSVPATATTPATATGTDATPEPVDETEAIIQQIERHGLHAIRHDDAVSTYHDPLYASGAYIFIDARDDAHYADGHVPGAYQINHYYIERYIDAVLPVAEAALKIIVYCNGGKCEDSEFTTLELLKRGIDSSKVFVYVGGMQQWRNAQLPIERGARGSGDLINAQPHPGNAHE